MASARVLRKTQPTDTLCDGKDGGLGRRRRSATIAAAGDRLDGPRFLLPLLLSRSGIPLHQQSRIQDMHLGEVIGARGSNRKNREGRNHGTRRVYDMGDGNRCGKVPKKRREGAAGGGGRRRRRAREGEEGKGLGEERRLRAREQTSFLPEDDNIRVRGEEGRRPRFLLYFAAVLQTSVCAGTTPCSLLKRLKDLE